MRAGMTDPPSVVDFVRLAGLQALGVCLYSQVRVLAFSDGDPAGSDQYRVPDSVQFSRYCLSESLLAPTSHCLRALAASHTYQLTHRSMIMLLQLCNVSALGVEPSDPRVAEEQGAGLQVGGTVDAHRRESTIMTKPPSNH